MVQRRVSTRGSWVHSGPRDLSPLLIRMRLLMSSAMGLCGGRVAELWAYREARFLGLVSGFGAASRHDITL